MGWGRGDPRTPGLALSERGRRWGGCRLLGRTQAVVFGLRVPPWDRPQLSQLWLSGHGLDFLTALGGPVLTVAGEQGACAVGESFPWAVTDPAQNGFQDEPGRRNH